MKIIMGRSKLVKGLKSVGSAITSKEALCIFSNVKLEARIGKAAKEAVPDEELDSVMLTASNEMFQVRSIVPAVVKESGAISLPGRFLTAFAEALPDGEVEIEVNKDGTMASVRGGECKYTLSAVSAEDFPAMEGPRGDNKFSIDAGVFRELFRKVRYAAASSDESRHVLRGVNVCISGGGMRMVATDGRRLSKVECFFNSERSSGAILGTLPSSVVKDLCGKLGDLSATDEVVVVVDGNKIRIKTDRFEIVAKLYEDAYPNFTKVIPAHVAFTAKVKRLAFLEELRRAAVSTVAGDGRSVKMAFGKGEVVFDGVVENISSSKTKAAIDYDGEPAKFTVAPSLIEDVLTAIDAKDVTIGFDGSGKPLVIKSDIDFVAVVMPWREG